MDSVFDLAFRHGQWLSARHRIIAGNVAGADLPGFRGSEVPPFERMLAAPPVTQATTHVTHFGARPADRAAATKPVPLHGEIALEQEMMKAAETTRAMALDTGVVRAFHRMILMAVRS